MQIKSQGDISMTFEPIALYLRLRYTNSCVKPLLYLIRMGGLKCSTFKIHDFEVLNQLL